MDLVVQKSRNGKGIFAGRDCAPEEVLYEVTGVFITGDEDEDIDETIRDNAFRFSEDLYISPAGGIGDFQNHSCEPNAKVVKREEMLFVVSCRAITKGEEIFIDYSTIIGADDIWEMSCNCGGSHCRTVVRSFDTLPKALQKEYRECGMVPDYIAQLS
ncbi:MAG TPA: SET domain-containing protein [Candidatus Paceibacterota bacterium]|nr:SET domain-containing protein [Candidatus Paceibacterota bacterium]